MVGFLLISLSLELENRVVIRLIISSSLELVIKVEIRFIIVILQSEPLPLTAGVTTSKLL